MSAPDTNLEKQERRHRWPLIGFAIGVVIAVLLGLLFLAGGGQEAIGVEEGAGPVAIEE